MAGKDCHWVAHSSCVHAILEPVKATTTNLGGLGPHFDDKPCMYLANFMHAQGENGENVTVDVDIRNTSVYTAVDTAKNGVDHAMGSINVRAGSSVNLNVTFINQKTSKPIVVKNAVITILDLDTSPVDQNGVNKNQESATVDGWYAYYVTNTTKVGITTLEDDRLFATALYPGNALDNPDSPINMTDDALDRAVAFEFHDRSHVQLSFAVANGNVKKGRNFMIAGFSALSMESTVVQIAYKKAPPLVVESIGRGVGLDHATPEDHFP